MPARRVSIVLVLLLSGLALAPVGADAGPRSGFSSYRARDGRAPARSWTAERMRAARPLPLTKIDPDAWNRPAPERDEPLTIGGSEPGSDSVRTYARTSGPLPFQAQEIVDPSVAPYSAHGMVFGSSVQGDYACSGTAVASDNKSVVWTAGHCLHLFGEFMTDVVFVPGYEKENPAPHGRWESDLLRVPTRWEQREDPRFDFGAFTVKPNASGQLLGDVVPMRGIAFNQQPTETFQSFGYPGVPSRFDGHHMHACLSEGSARLWAGMVAMGCDMQEGSSGGGWVMRGEYVASNVSGGNAAVWPNVSFGPYLGEAARTLYDSLRGGTAVMPSPTPTSPTPPPETHRMRLSLRLSNHLVATGRVVARDGFDECVRDVPIMIGRKRGDTFYSVGKMSFTDDDGRFRAKLRDRKGLYIAVSQGSPYDLTQDCTEAVSDFERHRH